MSVLTSFSFVLSISPYFSFFLALLLLLSDSKVFSNLSISLIPVINSFVTFLHFLLVSMPLSVFQRQSTATAFTTLAFVFILILLYFSFIIILSFSLLSLFLSRHLLYLSGFSFKLESSGPSL